MRKARPTFTGRVAKYIDFKIMPELAGSVVLLDGYFDIRFSPQAAPAQRQGQDTGRLRAAPRRRVSDLSRALGRLAARAEPRRRLSGAGRPRRRQAALLGRHLQRQPARRHQRDDGRRHEQRQGSRRARRRACRSGRRRRRPTGSATSAFTSAARPESDGALPSFRTSAGQTFFAFPRRRRRTAGGTG